MAITTHIKDHYKTLGIAPNASLQDIKKAYRQLALKYHPDKNPDQYAETHFREIQEAYDILSDTHKRRAYDEERWLTGMGNRARDTQVITPDWIYAESRKLSQHMATVDTYRMSHSALYDYLHLLLSDAHMAVLIAEQHTDTNHKIIQELIQATKGLKYQYMDEVANKMAKLAGNDNVMLQRIYQHLMERKRADAANRSLPWLVAVVTVVLCLLMWLYSRK